MKWWPLVVLALWSCSPPPPPPAHRQPPPRLEPLERVGLDAGPETKDSIYEVAPFTPVGPPPPADALRVDLDGFKATANGAPFTIASAGAEVPLLLVATEDTVLAQVSELLERLDDGHRQVWLKHPDAPLAYKLELRDEATFQEWLAGAEPGKVRIIQRADGFELSTNIGKLPGPDPNGPSVPSRGGKMDLATLQYGLERLKGRFKDAPDLCFMPSFATEVQATARAIAADYTGPDERIFKTVCLVYPRRRVDGGVTTAAQAPAEAPQDTTPWLLLVAAGGVALVTVLAFVARRRAEPPKID